MSKLVVSLDGKVINQHFLDKPSITIGRDTNNDVVIDDPLLSRAHVSIVKLGKDAIIEDLQSTNGTRVNGKPLVKQILQHRDVIELGRHQLRYMSAEIATEANFDRTMLIQTLPRQTGTEGTASVNVQLAPTAKAKLWQGRVEVMAGSPLPEGQIIELERVVTTFGVPGETLIVLTRRPRGIFITHVEGSRYPRINRRSIGNVPYELKAGDVIEAAGHKLKFSL